MVRLECHIRRGISFTLPMLLEASSTNQSHVISRNILTLQLWAAQYKTKGKVNGQLLYGME